MHNEMVADGEEAIEAITDYHTETTSKIFIDRVRGLLILIH